MLRLAAVVLGPLLLAWLARRRRWCALGASGRNDLENGRGKGRKKKGERRKETRQVALILSLFLSAPFSPLSQKRRPLSVPPIQPHRLLLHRLSFSGAAAAVPVGVLVATAGMQAVLMLLAFFLSGSVEEQAEKGRVSMCAIRKGRQEGRERERGREKSAKGKDIT